MRKPSAGTWRRTPPSSPDPAVSTGDPLVLTVTTALTKQKAAELAVEVDAHHDGSVVVDLTGIPSFDSEGAEALDALQHDVGVDRLSIVGLRQAAARIVASPETDEPYSELSADRLPITRLHHTAVIRPRPGEDVDAATLDRTLATALSDDVAIVVVDLRDSDEIQPAIVQSLAFASSEAALLGRELLVVNVSDADAERLRGSGLSATTYVAPQPDLG